MASALRSAAARRGSSAARPGPWPAQCEGWTKLSLFLVLSGLLMAASGIALAVRAIPVDQLTDVNATAATGMFSFAPDYLEIEPGEEVMFLNSTGEHTVHAVPEIWPDGVKRVAISNRPEASFTFGEEGFYGVTCRRHGRYGMVLLVKVGDPDGAGELKQTIADMRGSDAKKDALTLLVEEHLAE